MYRQFQHNLFLEAFSLASNTEEMAIYALVCVYQGKWHEAGPSAYAISSDTGIPQKRVMRLLKAMKKKGLVWFDVVNDEIYNVGLAGKFNGQDL